MTPRRISRPNLFLKPPRVSADVEFMRRVTVAVAIAVIVAILVAGCAPSYDADLLASIEGRWMCDVQRFTFDTQADIQAELDGRLAGNGVSVAQYRHFKDNLTSQFDLRQKVQEAYDQRCNT
ncbi:MAG: hypothetical protein GXP34_03240 [Actinobacteria bacterium]|nr:hypothetical protein [Actinomycetota bacterium]